MTINIFTHEPTSIDTLTKIRAELPSYLSGKRLLHTLSVEKEALRLSGMIFPYLGIDEKYLSDISASALLHDITKQFSFEKQKELCEKYAIKHQNEVGDAVLHSKTGAFFAREKYDVNDFVFGAIFFHTTGKEDMNIFEKIIFISDYIEETRTHTNCIEAREYFYSNAKDSNDLIKTLDMTIMMGLDSTQSYLEDKKENIDSQTIKARNFLLAEYALQRSVQE